MEKILEKAKEKQPSKCDVIESAQRLGIGIWLLPKIIIWIENLKARLGGSLEGQSSASKKRKSSLESCQEVKERHLEAPFIKYDDVSHENQPVICEFRRFPKIYCGGRAGQSPFFLPEATSGLKNKFRVLTKKPPQEKKVAKKAVNVNQGQQRGYCEICEAPFSELEEHISSKVHIARVGLDHLWTKLDTCIDQVNKVASSSEEDFQLISDQTL